MLNVARVSRPPAAVSAPATVTVSDLPLSLQTGLPPASPCLPSAPRPHPAQAPPPGRPCIRKGPRPGTSTTSAEPARGKPGGQGGGQRSLPVRSLTSRGSEDKPLKIGMSQEVPAPLGRRLPDRWRRRSMDQLLPRSTQPEALISGNSFFLKVIFSVLGKIRLQTQRTSERSPVGSLLVPDPWCPTRGTSPTPLILISSK